MCGCGCLTNLAIVGSTRTGAVKGKPQRYVMGHQSRKSLVEYVEQDCGYETPCWVWQRATDGRGYGQIRVRPDTCGAHRVYWERENGPIPEGLQLDHLCRNHACVRPSHLEPVTHVENIRRGAATKLTHEAVREIRLGGRSISDWSDLHHVTRQAIKDVLSRKSWSDVL